MNIEIRLAEVLGGHYDTHFGTGACTKYLGIRRVKISSDYAHAYGKHGN